MGEYLERLSAIGAELALSAIDKIALASVHVPDYPRVSPRGTPEHVHGYDRMGPDAMLAHLASHGLSAGEISKFSHPESLAGWHGADHLAKGTAAGHVHNSLHATLEDAHRQTAGEAHAAGHAAAGGHGIGHLPGLHSALTELPAVVHRETRRTVDRQTRRRLYRAVHKHGSKGPRGAKPPGGAGASGASGASGGSSGSSGGSGSGSGGSGGSGGGSR
jgi:uncharacterized membrane protein YgcG